MRKLETSEIMRQGDLIKYKCRCSDTVIGAGLAGLKVQQLIGYSDGRKEVYRPQKLNVDSKTPTNKQSTSASQIDEKNKENSQLAGEIRDYIDANNDFSSDFPVAASLLSRSEELLTGMER